MEHNIGGVPFRLSGISAPISGGRTANGAVLLRETRYRDLRPIRGSTIPGLGLVLEIGAPKMDLLPEGTVINIVV